MAKKQLTAQQTQNKYRALSRTTFVSEFAAIGAPYIVMGAFKHDEWFHHENGWKVGLGGALAMALVGITVLSISFEEEKMKTRQGKYIRLLLTWIIMAFIFMLLADIMNQIANIMFVGALGLASALGLDITSANYKAKADMYGKVIREAKENVVKAQVEKELKTNGNDVIF